jgi:SM-20-related protein
MHAFADLSIASALVGPGWIVLDDFLDAPAVEALHAAATATPLVAARVGGGDSASLHPQLRGDRTRWIASDTVQPDEQSLLQRFDALRAALNETLYAGLVEVEAHHALYPPGARYGLHRDRFRDDDRRVVSCVVYLNRDWATDDGGALRLYADAGDALIDIAPLAGRAVLFLSERFPHEVLPSVRERRSIAAWFLRRGR